MGSITVTTKPTANDLQYGGRHYKSLKIEPWDFIAANNLGFFEGNVIRYVSRWKEKNGVEDLRKAVHFLEKLIELETQRECDEKATANPLA